MVNTFPSPKIVYGTQEVIENNDIIEQANKRIFPSPKITFGTQLVTFST